MFVSFNNSLYFILSYLTFNLSNPAYCCLYTLNIFSSSQVKNVVSTLKTVTSTKDLGVTVDENLNFKEHTTTKINKAFSMLGILKRNFKHTDKDTFVNLYKTIVRSHLDYVIS